MRGGGRGAVGQVPPSQLLKVAKGQNSGKAKAATARAAVCRAVNISFYSRNLKNSNEILKNLNYIKFYKSLSKMSENLGKANPGKLRL